MSCLKKLYFLPIIYFNRDTDDEESNEYVQQRKLYDKVISNIKTICRSVNQVNLHVLRFALFSNCSWTEMRSVHRYDAYCFLHL